MKLIKEKSVSKAQQRFMGMVHAAQKGEMENPSKEVEKAADSMSDADAKDYASTKHTGLPNHMKKENMETKLKEIIRQTYKESLRESVINESVSHEAMGIASMTNTRKEAVQKFIDDNNLNANEILKVVTNGGLVERVRFIQALVGTPNNSSFKWYVKNYVNESVNEATFVKGKTYGGTNCEGGCYLGKQGLLKLIKISKDNPDNVFMFRDDNYSGLQPHFIKNGVIAKATTINPAYDLDKSKVKNLNIGKDVILSVKLFESTNESVNEAPHSEVYFDSFTSAAEFARKSAETKGFEIDENDWQTKVALGGSYGRSRPSVGKTHRFTVGLLKNGKPQRKALTFTVYGMKSGNYELVNYIN